MDIVTLALAMKNGGGGGVDESVLASMISEQISEVIDGAPQSFDTLKEISDWIDNHQDDYEDLLEIAQGIRSATVQETLDYLEANGIIAPEAESEEF